MTEHESNDLIADFKKWLTKLHGVLSWQILITDDALRYMKTTAHAITEILQLDRSLRGKARKPPRNPKFDAWILSNNNYSAGQLLIKLQCMTANRRLGVIGQRKLPSESAIRRAKKRAKIKQSLNG